jgi:hypothetical protein
MPFEARCPVDTDDAENSEQAATQFHLKFPKVKSIPMDVLLLRWVNFHLSNALSPGYKLLQYRRRVENFSTSMKDGECLAVLLHQLDPAKAPKAIAQQKDPDKRAKMVFDAVRALTGGGGGKDAFFAPSHIRMGNAPVLVGVISMLFCAYGGVKTIDEQQTLRISETLVQLKDNLVDTKKSMRVMVAKLKSSHCADEQLREAESEYLYVENQLIDSLNAVCKTNDEVR